ncbi:hypothetical protein CC117_30980 [Parafrankia colletiae]|uniref:Uncharacterized protein n=1 Tax=Parafrankia colletiae TaxID=573497 RepID=A0A1S1Q3H8_9ACTN|nr:hypothetical protein CC117_30980 [Parafrankia colletiae]
MIDEPPVAGTVPARPRCLDQQEREALRSPVHGHVINLYAAFSEQLLDVPVGQCVPQVLYRF